PRIWARALGTLGRIEQGRGDTRRALTLCAASLRRCRALDDRPGIAQVTATMGLAFYRRGDYARSQAAGDQSLPLARDMGDVPGPIMLILTGLLATLAAVAGETGGRALALADEHLAMARATGDRYVMASALQTAGIVDRALGRVDRAEGHAHEELALGRELDF